MQGTGKSGTTFDGIKKVICKTRPAWSCLENVKELSNKVTDQDPDGTELVTSQDKWVKAQFEKDGFSVILLQSSAKRHGSRAERIRIFPLVFDIPRWAFDELKAEEFFFRTFDSLCLEPYQFERFCMAEECLATVCSPLQFGMMRPPCAKKSKEYLGWKTTHEELFSYHSCPWPPQVDHIKDLRPREQELLHFVDWKFPHKTLAGEKSWEFFDINHTAERSLRWPLREMKNGQLSTLRRPWHIFLPTMTAHSVIVTRHVNEQGVKTLRRVHALECFRCQGWDLEFYQSGLSPFLDGITIDTIQDLCGNSWNAFSYLAVHIAASGCVDWAAADRLIASRKGKDGDGPDGDGPDGKDALEMANAADVYQEEDVDDDDNDDDIWEELEAFGSDEDVNDNEADNEDAEGSHVTERLEESQWG